MATVKIYNTKKEEVGELQLSDAVFGVEPKRHLLHLVVRKQLAARRAGTHAVKRRSSVSGGGKKPFKQKGTGRARQGSTRSPHMRGGGVVFGPEPRSHDFKVNKKETRAALLSALSVRAGEGTLVVLDALDFDTPKTRNFRELLGTFGLDSALVVADVSANLELAGRNLQHLTVLSAGRLNVYDVLKRKHLVLTRAAVEAVTARLGGEE